MHRGALLALATSAARRVGHRDIVVVCALAGALRLARRRLVVRRRTALGGVVFFGTVAPRSVAVPSSSRPSRRATCRARPRGGRCDFRGRPWSALWYVIVTPCSFRSLTLSPGCCRIAQRMSRRAPLPSRRPRVVAAAFGSASFFPDGVSLAGSLGFAADICEIVSQIKGYGEL